jgi:multidrug transporter EmrE-like cation transporter
MHWIYLFLGAVFETAWTYSLKVMKFSDLKTVRWNNILDPQTGLSVILPFLGYIVFGIGNIIFFSMAMKKIPAATAFAVWTAMAITLIKLTDVVVLNQKLSLGEVFFLVMITVGIIGLKYNTAE